MAKNNILKKKTVLVPQNRNTVHWQNTKQNFITAYVHLNVKCRSIEIQEKNDHASVPVSMPLSEIIVVRSDKSICKQLKPTGIFGILNSNRVCF